MAMLLRMMKMRRAPDAHGQYDDGAHDDDKMMSQVSRRDVSRTIILEVLHNDGKGRI